MSPSTLPTSRSFTTQLFDSLSTVPQTNTTTNIDASNPLNTAPEAIKKQLLALHVLFPNELLPALDLLDRRLVTRFRIYENVDSHVDDGVLHVGHSTNADLMTERCELERVAETERIPRTPDKEMDIGRDEPSTFTPPHLHVTELLSIDAEMLDTGPHKLESTEPSSIIQHPDERDQTAQKDVGSTTHHGANKEEERKGQDVVYYVRSAQQRSSRFTASYDSTTHYEVRLRAWNCSCPAFAFAAFPSAFSDATVPNPGAEVTESKMQENEWSFGAASLGRGTPPVCKHLLACVLGERCALFEAFVEEKIVSVDEAAGWAAGWGD